MLLCLFLQNGIHAIVSHAMEKSISQIISHCVALGREPTQEDMRAALLRFRTSTNRLPYVIALNLFTCGGLLAYTPYCVAS